MDMTARETTFRLPIDYLSCLDDFSQ